jgi:hypothetical protein
LPTISGKCLSIVRLEQGKMEELGDLLIKILPKGGLPRGSIVLVGSLSQLQKENVAGYATACVKIVKRFDGFFKKEIRTVPFVPPPMGGCDNPRMGKDILDLCCWLENMADYPLRSAMGFLAKTVDIQEGGGEGGSDVSPPLTVSFPHENIFLPFAFDDYKGQFVQSPGRPDYLAALPVWPLETEKKFIVNLIQDLNSQLLQDLDTDPNFSRSKSRPAMHAALRTGSVDSAIIIGGSNAGQLADCCTALGLDVVKHVKSGWKINKESVDLILPELAKTFETTSKNVPVIIQGLDNTAYFGATEDGGMAPLSQCVPKDKGYHAIGALVVASDRSISASVSQLNRLICACGDRQIFILSVMPRFIIMPCCDHPGHMTNFLDENYLQTILRDLAALRTSIKRMLVGGQLIDVMELICGDQYTMEKAAVAARTGWTTDPVHPSRHTIAKIGLHLIEKMGNYVPVAGGGDTGGKRVAAAPASRQENRAEKKRRREDDSEDARGPIRTPRSESWRERGRGGGRQRGGNGPRGGQNHGGYGTHDSSYNSRQRDGHQNYGYPGRGQKGGGGGGYRGRQYRGGMGRWDYPY